MEPAEKNMGAAHLNKGGLLECCQTRHRDKCFNLRPFLRKLGVGMMTFSFGLFLVK